jgi:four helix bundle protein
MDAVRFSRCWFAKSRGLIVTQFLTTRRWNGAAERATARAHVLRTCDFTLLIANKACGTRCAQTNGMSGIRRFEDLIVWQLAVQIRDRIYALTDAGPASRDFEFRDQIRDSASSAPRNISEGFLRFNPPEFATFMNTAKGSLGETQNHLLHAKELAYFTEAEFNTLWRLSCRALRSANRLHAYLRRCGRRKPNRG